MTLLDSWTRSRRSVTGPTFKKEHRVRAAVLTEPNTDLQLVDRKAPAPGPGEVVIRVRACGICHSDVALQGGTTRLPRSRVPGHEVA